MRLSIYDLVLQALLGAILLAVQVALAPLPNIELVSLLCLVYTLVYGKRALLSIYTFVLLEGLVYGFGLWWVMYLYVWAILWGIVMLLRRNRSVILWCLVLGLYGLFFGALCAIPYLFAAEWAPRCPVDQRHPFDIAHCLETRSLCWCYINPYTI